ncbi:MAG: hypothetical protein AAF126_22970, partial [Chloroflexota bacterium]
MTTIDDLTEKMQMLFTITAEQLGRESGFIQQQRKVKASEFVQALVLGSVVTPEATRKQQHQHASA